jgi:hypothetical protein
MNDRKTFSFAARNIRVSELMWYVVLSLSCRIVVVGPMAKDHHHLASDRSEREG